LKDQEKYSEAQKVLEQAKSLADSDQVEPLEKELIEAIRLTKTVPDTHPEVVKAKKYEEWIRSKGAHIEKCKLKWKNPTHPYLVATADIAKGQDIVEIPYAEWMPLESILPDSPLCLALNEKGELVNQLRHPWRNSFFAVFFIEQLKMGDKSKYKDYVQNLPSDLSHFPSNFSQKEIDENLKGSTAIQNKIKAKNQADERDFEILCAAHPALKDAMTLDEFKKGKIWASTRAYDLAFTDGQIRQVLIPFIEFSPINYGSEQNVRAMQLDGQLKLRTCKDIKKGDIIVQQQARAGNTDVFLNSGFCASGISHLETAMVECELDPSDPLFAVKLELLETPDSYHNYYLRENFTNADTYCIFSFLRFAVYNEDQAYLILAKS